MTGNLRKLKLWKRNARRAENQRARLQKNRFGFNIALALMFAFIAAIMAIPTFGATIFAAAPAATLGAKSVFSGKMFIGMAAASPVSLRAQFPRNRNANYGIQLEPIAGINLSSTLMTATLDSDRRYHQLTFQTTAVNYTGGTAKAITALTGSGTGATGTLTISNGLPTAIAIVAAGSGFAANDTFTIADATGTGFVGKVLTVSSGAIATVSIVTAGTPSAVDPRLVIGNIYLIVGTTAVVETTAAMEIYRALFNYQPISAGQFPIYFTEPWRNLTDGRATSWDMAGQGIFTVKFQMLGNYSQVNVTGLMNFDYIRNTVAGEIDQVTYQSYVATGNFPAPRLQIIARKLLSATLNGGVTPLAPAVIPTGWPILRMHFFPATPGTLNNVLMKADTQIIQQGQIGVVGSTIDQLNEQLIERGFNTTLTNNAPSIAPDYVYVADYDQRVQNKLKVSNLALTITSTGNQQALTILQEYLETSYS